MRAGPAWVARSCGAKAELLPMIGTAKPLAAATPTSEAACRGPALITIALTPACLRAVTWAVMSLSVGLIFCSTTVSPASLAMCWEPTRALSP
ncbi:UNVERIFIED_CONTAM: hypothetical protein RKD50_007407 [Streptomyces canus]